MKTSEVLAIKADLNNMKLNLINMGLSLKDQSHSKEDALAEVIECISYLEIIDQLLKFEIPSKTNGEVY